MSEQGLEVIDSSMQKTYEWIGCLAEVADLEKRDAYRTLRAVLQTLRDRLPIDDAVHFAAQLPLFLRGLYYEGWEPARVPIKRNREQFLETVREKIVTSRLIEPQQAVHDVLVVIGQHLSPGEAEKIKHCFPADLQSLWPQFADV